MTTAGDLILGGTAGAAGRLARGADSQVLTTDPTTHLPVWTTPVAVVWQDDISSQANGTATVFTLSNAYVANSTIITLNGIRQRVGAGKDYTETSSTQITFATAPLTGDIVLAAYQTSGAVAGGGVPFSANIYIATTGNDTTGNGTSGSPWATLAMALSAIPDAPGASVTIHVADGTYAEAVTLRRFRCQSPVLISIVGNTTTPANVVFTGTVSTDDSFTTGGLVSGQTNVMLQGIKINVTAHLGLVIESHARCIVDRCIVTGTISRHGIIARDTAFVDFKGNCSVSGYGTAGNYACGIYIMRQSTGVYSAAGTLTITGGGGVQVGLAAQYKGEFEVGRGIGSTDWVTGCNITITQVLQGIVASLGSVFQHYSPTGTISITNSSTPSGSSACYSGDASTWSINQAIIIDHFSTGFTAECVAYLEAIGSRTVTNVGATSGTKLAGTIYLP
jgi:hypothetical protein